LPRASTGAIARAASSAKERSGVELRPCPRNGVGTAMMKAPAGSLIVVARSLPISTTRRTSASRLGSPKCGRPALMVATTLGFTSTPTTSTPFSAKMAAVGSPI
jgi:hypothetical protein